VVFSVDGTDAGITNVRPFTWDWDTASVPNGAHVVRLTAVRADGSSKSQEMRVVTENPNAPAAPKHPGIEDVDALLDDALSLRPDLRYARYVLAQAALEAGDSQAARTRLTAVVAEDPKYQNAAHLLKTLPRDTDGAEVWRGPTGRKVIALTFDDGPNPGRTPELLDLLKRLDVRATFFFVGKQAVQYPDIVRRAAAEGHEVGNHTWNHRNLQKLSEPEALRELASANRLLGRLAGRTPRFFRPPGGNISAAARDAGAALDLTPAMWTFLGGKTEGMPVEIMAPEFIQAAQPGAIFLIHDGTKKIGEMLPIVVEKLRAEGYDFVTLSELFSEAPSPMRTAAG
jgi:peptidoglycan/xylan/chitin deacetylase (PgdA/CDA1 family)